MATCRVQRNNSGRITKVKNENGTEAKLFNSIAKHPMISNEEEALGIFKNTLTDKVGDNPTFTHKVNGEIVDSYKKALKKSKEGDLIEIGFNSEKGFQPIISMNKTTDRGTQEGFINNMIENNLLSEFKKKTKFGYKFQSAGKSTNAKIVNSEIIRDSAGAYLGIFGVGKDGTTFDLRKVNDKVNLVNHDGSITTYEKKEIDKMSYEELKRLTPYYLDFLLAREVSRNRPSYGFKQPEINMPSRSESELQSLLLNFMSKLGISTMNISEYVEKYNIKNGVDPSANALADISNKIIAFHEGKMGLEALTEEVAHFINEAMPQEQVEEVLKNVHKSKEWKEFADSYRDIYSKRYKGEQLENAVRREILGKILANSILNRFNTENMNSEQMGFVAKAYEMVTKFFEKIQAYFRPEYRTQLDSYLDNVEEILRADEISNMLNTDNFDGNNLVLYNTNAAPKTDIKISAEKAIISFRDQIQHALSRAKKGSSLNKQKLKRLQDKLEDNKEISAVADINSLANTYIKMLSKSIEDARKNNKSYIFTQEENVIFQALKNQIVPSLGELKVIIKNKKENRKEWSALEKEIAETINKASDLSAEASTQDAQAIKNLIDKVMIRHELPESHREYMEKWIETAEAETNWFHSNFGMLTHSRDGLLNLAGMIQKDIATQSNIKWQEATKKYQQQLRKLGISEKEISKNFVDGNFIVNEYDFNKFEEVLERLEANLYKEIMESNDSIEDIIQAKKDGTIEPMNSKQEVEYKRRLKDLRNPLLERKFKSSYYAEFENKLSNLGISQEGIKFTMNYYGDMSQFKRAAKRNVNGKEIMDFSQLSEQDKALMDDLIKYRNSSKSYFNEEGNLKKGLEFNSNGEIVPSSTVELSEEAQIAIDLHKMDESRDPSIDMNESGIPQIFLDTLREIDDTDGREAALEFLKLNSYIGFTQKYWDDVELSGGRGINARMEKYINDNPLDLTAKDVLKDIEEDRNKLKSILKVYRSKNNPSEIDVDAMPRTSRETVKMLQQRLMDNYKQAKQITKNVDMGESDATNPSISYVNDAYFNKLEDLDAIIDFDTDSKEDINRKLKDEVKFASEHMTDSNSVEINSLVQEINRYKKAERHTLPLTVERKLEELNFTKEDLIDDKVYVNLVQELTRDRILPYYSRFAPVQYNAFMREINEGTDNLADIVPSLAQKYDFMEVTPNYSFFDESQNQNMNPNYTENFEGGYLQPKKELSNNDVEYIVSRIGDNNERKALKELISKNGLGFKSAKFNELFGSNPSGNLYEAYKATLEYNNVSLEAMGVGNNYNKYTLPQVKKNRMERVEKMSTNPSLLQIREALSEELTYTEDDKIQGEKSKFGDSIKIIPSMYVDRLNNPEDVSNELFYSLALRAKEAYLREARVEHYGDFMAIYDKVLNRSYKGKDVDGSNTLKMFESAMDYSLFGIKETAMYPIKTMFGTIDVAKLARKLLGFIKFRNLGLNVVIPITSYLTGKTTREIEKYVGEHMDRRSQALGDKEFRKHATEAISEIGEINTGAKINVMGQFFQAFDLSESFNNSNYGKFLRFLPRTGMMLHTGANFPIYGSTLFGVLHDFRVVNGSILRFNQFERQKLSEGLSKKEIKDSWNRLEEDAIYNFIEVKDGEVIFDDATIRTKVVNQDGEQMSDAEYEAFKKEKIQAIRAHVSNVITNIDGQIPNEARVHAQRHFALNYFMTHRGWLSIVTSRRFKHRHLNVETGEIEEGSYRTLWNFMGRYLKEFKKGNFSDFVKNWKNVFDNADPQEAQLMRRNMKRIGIEMSLLNGLMLLGFLLNGMADDDEYAENYGVQGLSYLFNRTLNEMSSAQMGSINNFSEVIESPFVGWSTVKTFTDAGDLFSGEEVKYGSYRGLSERQRFLTKLVPGAKQIHDLSSAKNVKTMRNTYMFYNSGNFNYTPLGNLYWLGEEDK